MSEKPARPRLRLSLILLLCVCGGMLAVLYVQRQQITREKQRQQVQTAARSMERQVQDPLARVTPEELAEIQRLDPEQNIDQLLGRLYNQAQASNREFQTAFGKTAGERVAVLRPNSRATTSAEFEEQYRRYYQRDIDQYLAHTQDDGPLKEAGEAFLKAAFFGEHPLGVPTTEETIAGLAEEVLRSETKDPLLRAHALFRIPLEEDRRETSERLEKEVAAGLEQLSRAKYAPVVELMLRNVLNFRVKSSSTANETNRKLRLNMAAVRWLKDESSASEWHRCVYRRLTDIVDAKNRLQLLALAAREPDIAPYWLHLLAGEYYLNQATIGRGNEFADKVTPEQWKKYHENSDKAMIHLHRAWFLHPEYPEAAQMMIGITLGNDDKGRTSADWFNKALEAQFDYQLAYTSYLLSLLTRWGGSDLQMIDFAKECLATDRFDTFVPYFLFEVMESLERWEEHPPETQLAKFPTLKATLDALCRQRAAWIKNFSGHQQPFISGQFPDNAILIYLANQCFQEAREVALTVPDDYLPHRFSQQLRSGAYEIAKLKASDKPVRPLLDDLDERLRRDRTAVLSAEAESRLMEDFSRLKELATDPTAQRCLKHLETMVNQRIALSRGEWVDLLNGPETLGWEFFAASVRYEESSRSWVLRGSANFRLPLMGRPLIDLSGPLEIEADMGLLTDGSQPEFGQAKGIAWSLAEGPRRTEASDPKQQPFLRLFGLAYRGRERVMAAFPRSCYVTTYGDIESEQPLQKLRLKLWDNAFEFHAKELAVVDQLCVPLDPAGLLTFGETASSPNRSRDLGSLRLGRVRVRRLTSQPPPAKSDPKDLRLAYWQGRCDADSEDFLAVRELSRLSVQTEPNRALQLARRVQELQPRMNGVHCTIGLALVRLGQFEEAERELKRAEQEQPYEPDVNVGLIELCLARPDPTPEMYRSAEQLARYLANEGEPCSSKALSARLAFAQGQLQNAVHLNAEAVKLAADSEVGELQTRQEQYEAALQESSAK